MTIKQSISKSLVGTDIYINWKYDSPEILAEKLKDVSEELVLTRIINRGVKVWSADQPEESYTDYWQCRFMGDKNGKTVIMPAQIIMLLARINGAGLDILKMENLYGHNGKIGNVTEQEE